MPAPVGGLPIVVGPADPEHGLLPRAGGRWAGTASAALNTWLIRSSLGKSNATRTTRCNRGAHLAPAAATVVLRLWCVHTHAHNGHGHGPTTHPPPPPHPHTPGHRHAVHGQGLSPSPLAAYCGGREGTAGAHAARSARRARRQGSACALRWRPVCAGQTLAEFAMSKLRNN